MRIAYMQSLVTESCGRDCDYYASARASKRASRYKAPVRRIALLSYATIGGSIGMRLGFFLAKLWGDEYCCF